MFDPFAPKPSKHTAEERGRIFGPKSDSRLAQELMLRNPALYAELKQEAIAAGELAAPPRKWYERTPARVFSPEELALRARHSEAEVKEFFRGNVGKVAKDNRPLYDEMKAAGISYGLLDAVSHNEARRPADEFFPLNDELADKANLPRGHRVNAQGFADVLRAIEDAEAARKKAA